MEEAHPDYVYRNNVQETQKCVARMFNNSKCSDTIFFVNESKFHASSHLLTITSKAFDTMINTHYDNCGDREIKIRDVKFDESFCVILKCIYGVEINFTRMDKWVMCEVLSLAVSFHLTDFSKDLKSYLSKMETFQIDSVVPMLNTSKKFDLNDLYAKLSTFACKNAEKLVKHDSFKELQHDVLMDLLPSDCFYAKEIDILAGVLHWHGDMYNKDRNVKKERETLSINEGSEAVEDEDVSEGEFDDIACELNVAESNDTTSHSEETGDKDSKGVTENTSEGNVELSFTRDNETDAHQSTAESNDTTSHSEETGDKDSKGVTENTSEGNAELSAKSSDVKSETDAHQSGDIVMEFSETVLKSLLSHIRVSRISLMEMHVALETELFKKYKAFLTDIKYFSMTCKPRECVSKNMIITKKFFVKSPSNLSVFSYSDDSHLQGNCEWNISIKAYGTVKPYQSTYDLHVYINCTSIQEGNWTCTAHCQVRLISQDPECRDLILPQFKKSKPMTFSSTATCVECGVLSWSWEEYIRGSAKYGPKGYEAANESGVRGYTFEVDFYSIDFKLNEN